MSYAALLALLATLAFTLPFLARLGENVGIPRSYGIIVTLALGLVLAMYAYLRWRLRDADEPQDLEPGVLPEKPYIPEFFFQDGVFQGERLITQGHHDAALKMYEAYRALLKRQGMATDEVDKMIVHLVNEEAENARLQGTG